MPLSPPTDLSVSIEPSAQRHLVSLAGELTQATLKALKDAMTAVPDDGRKVTFDLDEVAFIDSTGLGYFVGLHRASLSGGFAFSVRRPSPIVTRVCELSALDRLLCVE